MKNELHIFGNIFFLRTSKRRTHSSQEHFQKMLRHKSTQTEESDNIDFDRAKNKNSSNLAQTDICLSPDEWKLKNNFRTKSLLVAFFDLLSQEQHLNLRRDKLTSFHLVSKLFVAWLCYSCLKSTRKSNKDDDFKYRMSLSATVADVISAETLIYFNKKQKFFLTVKK